MSFTFGGEETKTPRTHHPTSTSTRRFATRALASRGEAREAINLLDKGTTKKRLKKVTTW